MKTLEDYLCKRHSSKHLFSDTEAIHSFSQSVTGEGENQDAPPEVWRNAAAGPFVLLYFQFGFAARGGMSCLESW